MNRVFVISDDIWLDYESIKAPSSLNLKNAPVKLTDHEYHEIGNEELNGESPRFEVHVYLRFRLYLHRNITHVL